MILLFLSQTQKFKNKPLLSLQKKIFFASMIFSKFCYVACTINHVGKLICLCVCLHKHYCAGLTDKPAFGSGQKTPSNFLNLLKYSNFKKAFLSFFYQEIRKNESANIFDHKGFYCSVDNECICLQCDERYRNVRNARNVTVGGCS